MNLVLNLCREGQGWKKKEGREGVEGRTIMSEMEGVGAEAGEPNPKVEEASKGPLIHPTQTPKPPLSPFCKCTLH